MSRRWILDDAERALLAAFNAQGLGPLEVGDADGAFATVADTHGFGPDRLIEAIQTLADKGLLERVGDRLRMSKEGFLASHEAAEALKAGVVPF